MRVAVQAQSSSAVRTPSGTSATISAGVKRASSASRVLEGVLARECRRRDVAGRKIGACKAERVADRRQRAEIIVRAALEQLFLDDRPRRHDAHDVAAHQLVRYGRFELFGERDDEALRDELRQIRIERVMRHARHRDALALSRFLRRQRDRQRARQRLGVLAVSLVEIADAREQERLRDNAPSSRSTAPASASTGSWKICSRPGRDDIPLAGRSPFPSMEKRALVPGANGPPDRLIAPFKRPLGERRRARPAHHEKNRNCSFRVSFKVGRGAGRRSLQGQMSLPATKSTKKVTLKVMKPAGVPTGSIHLALNLLANLQPVARHSVGRRFAVTARTLTFVLIVIAGVPRRLGTPHFNCSK